MKFCLISGKSGEDVKHIFIDEAKKHFDTVLSVPLDSIRIDCENGESRLFFKNTDLTTFDVVYVRVFENDFLFAEIVLDILESSGVYMPTFLDGYQITNHKFFTIQRIARIGAPVPDSVLAITQEAALSATKKIGFPIVLKLLRGFGGKGVMLVKSEDELRPILDTIKVFDELLSAQRYIETQATDVRALVIGEEVIGIRRRGQGGEFRANVSAGGSAEIFDLDENTAEIALNASRLLGLEICAIDFIEAEHEPMVIEANFTPGIMPKYFGSDLAGKMLTYMKQRAEEQAFEEKY